MFNGEALLIEKGTCDREVARALQSETLLPCAQAQSPSRLSKEERKAARGAFKMEYPTPAPPVTYS